MIKINFFFKDGVPNDKGSIAHLNPLPVEKKFNILLDLTENVRVIPKGTLDVPVVFCPEELKQYKCTLALKARREAKMSWADKDELNLINYSQYWSYSTYF